MSNYDLRDRSFRFSIDLVKFVNHLSASRCSYPIINQLIRSGTSIGANIEEADSSPTRKDCKHKMTISKKEAGETVYWLRILIDARIIDEAREIETASKLLDESSQLLRILGSIIRKI